MGSEPMTYQTRLIGPLPTELMKTKDSILEHTNSFSLINPETSQSNHG